MSLTKLINENLKKQVAYLKTINECFDELKKLEEHEKVLRALQKDGVYKDNEVSIQ
ncbi:MAG: hypothetical protein ACOX6V_05505 [Patescibacteria group bacterium]|jgi:hypothetical protein